MKNSPKKKAITLSIIFAAAYVIHGVGNMAFLISNNIRTGTFLPDSLVALYFIVTAAIIALVYLPLSIWIHRLARNAQMKILKIISLVAIIVASMFLAALGLAIPLMLSFFGLPS